jgi:hypothetical protein
MRTETIPAAASPQPGSRAPRGLGALAGLLACGAALGVAELVAGVVGAQASPLVAVGGSAIDATPEWLKEFAIRTFGERDKLVLLAGIAAVLAGFAAAVGLLAGAVALTVLIRAVLPGTAPTRKVSPSAAPSREPRARAPFSGPAPGSDLSTAGVGVDRRQFLVTGVVAAGGPVGAGRVLGGRSDVGASRAGVAIPRPASAAGALAEEAAIDVPGLSSFFTPSKDFYRVDTALVVPRVAAEDWRLRVHGRVERELTLDFTQLLARPLIERDITLSCVSNEVGGRYVGTARWVGVPLRDLLKRPGCGREPTSSFPDRPTGSPSGSPPRPCSTDATPCWPWP